MASSHQSAFNRRLLRHGMRWRARRDHGTPDARTSPMLTDWVDGIHPDWQQAAHQMVEEDGVRLHSHVAALNSSMAFAFNLFLPGRDEPQRLGTWASGVVGEHVEVERLVFEWVPPGRLLGELRGKRPAGREPATGIDVVIWCRAGERKVVLLIEVKLGEVGFTPCGGHTSRANRRTDLCDSAEAFFAEPEGCYLRRPARAVRDRRYWSIFAEEHGSVRAAFPGLSPRGPCPFAEDLQQPMRQHALALGLEQAGLADAAWLGLVHHDLNPDVVAPWGRFQAGVAPGARVFRAPASDLLFGGPVEWAAWMRERYDLPEAA